MLRCVTLVLAMLAVPAFSETVTVDTYRGPVAVPYVPETIAVLDIAALDNLDALGISADAVVRPMFVDYLAAATEDAVAIGTLFEPDYEALAALRPDLIIAGGRSYKAVPKLEKIAPTIDMTIWEDVISQGEARLAALGQIFDKTAEADDLAQTLRTKLKQTQQAVVDQGNALVIMTNGPKISAYGGQGRFGWIYSALGLPEAVPEIAAATHGEVVSFEFIRDADPDILIVVDRLSAIAQSGDIAQVTLDNALVRETNAWKTGRVIYLDSAPLYIAAGGVQSMTMTLDQIASAFAGN